MDQVQFEMSDFNLEEEVKVTPLIPAGTYHAFVTKVEFNAEQKTIDWVFTMNENGGVLSDGETPIDGATLSYRNWLPKDGDENELTKNGRMTKRQAKINMLGQFAESLGIDMNSPQAILENLANQSWVGIAADIKVRSREYQGRVFNDIDRVIG